MNNLSRVIVIAGKSLIIVAAMLAAVYWAYFWWLAYTAPLPYEKLDLNHDGRVSFAEVSYAASFGKRVVQVSGQQCTEYFAYKDGLPLKTVCGSGE